MQNGFIEIHPKWVGQTNGIERSCDGRQLYIINTKYITNVHKMSDGTTAISTGYDSYGVTETYEEIKNMLI